MRNAIEGTIQPYGNFRIQKKVGLSYKQIKPAYKAAKNILIFCDFTLKWSKIFKSVVPPFLSSVYQFFILNELKQR